MSLNDHKLIQIDDNDKLISVSGTSVQLALTSKDSVSSLITALYAENTLQQDIDIKIITPTGQILSDTGVLADNIIAFQGMIKIGPQIGETGMHPIMTKGDSDEGGPTTPCIIQFITKTGWDTRSSTRVVVMDLADAKSHVASALSSTSSKHVKNGTEYTLSNNIGDVHLSEHLPVVYAHIGTNSLTWVKANANTTINAGYYAPVCGGSIYQQHVYNAGGTAIDDGVTYSLTSGSYDAEIQGKFLPFVRLDGNLGFHVVPEINGANSKLDEFVMVPGANGATIKFKTVDDQVISTTDADVTFRLVSDEVEFSTLSDAAAGFTSDYEHTFDTAQVFANVVKPLQFASETATYDAGFRDLGAPGDIITTFTHFEKLAQPAGELFTGSQITATVSHADTNELVDDSTKWHYDDAQDSNSVAISYADAVADLGTSVLSIERQNSSFSYSSTLVFTMTVAFADSSAFLDSALPAGASKTITFTRFLQGTHAFAQSRDANAPGEIEVDNTGQPLRRELTGAAYANQIITVTSPAPELLAKTFLRGDTVLCYSSADATEHDVSTQIDEVQQQDSSELRLKLKDAVVETARAKFVVQMDIVQNVSILSAIVFDDTDGQTASNKFLLRGLDYRVDAEKKEDVAVTVSKPDGYATGEFKLAFAEAHGITSTGDAVIEFNINLIKAQYQDLDMFARGTTTIDEVISTTALKISTRARGEVFDASGNPIVQAADILNVPENNGIFGEITSTATIITFNNVSGVAPALSGGSAGDGVKFIRGLNNSDHSQQNVDGDFKIERAEDDGDANKLAFHVRYVPHTTGDYNVATLRAAVLAERDFSGSIYTNNTILPFPNASSATGDNEFTSTKLSTDVFVRQGLDGIAMSNPESVPRIAGPEGDYLADVGLIDTGAMITGYFNGQAKNGVERGAYTIGSVKLDGVPLHKTALVVDNVPAGSNSFAVTTDRVIDLTKYYEVGMEDAQSVGGSGSQVQVFPTNTVAQFAQATDDNDVAIANRYIMTLFEENGVTDPSALDTVKYTSGVTTLAQIKSVAQVVTDGTGENYALTFYEKKSNQDEVVVDDGGKKVILRKNGDDAKIMIQAENGSYWAEGTRQLTFVVNNSGTGSEITPTTFQVVQKRPELTIALTDLHLEAVADIPKFNLQYRVSNIDGDFTLVTSNLTALAISSADGATQTKTTGALTVPNGYALGNTLLTIAVAEYSGFTKSAPAYDFFSTADGSDVSSVAVVTTAAGVDFEPDQLHPETKTGRLTNNGTTTLNVTAGTTGFQMLASDLLFGGLTGGIRNVSFAWSDESEPDLIANTADDQLAHGAQIASIGTQYDGKTLTMTVTNTDNVASHSSRVENLAAADLPLLMAIGGNNLSTQSEATQTFSHSVTFQVASQFTLSAEKSTVVFLNDDAVVEHIKFTGTHLVAHDTNLAQLTGAGAVNATTPTGSTTTTFYKVAASGSNSFSFSSVNYADNTFGIDGAAARALVNPGNASVSKATTVTFRDAPEKVALANHGTNDDPGPFYQTYTDNNATFYKQIVDERLMPASDEASVKAQEFRVNNVAPVAGSGFSVSYTNVDEQLINGISLRYSAFTPTSSALAGTYFTVSTRFHATDSKVANSTNGFYKDGDDVTYTMTWTYDRYYTLTENEGAITVGYPQAETRALSWTLQHAVVNTEEAVLDIHQYYDTNNTDAIRVYRGIGQSTPDLVSNISSNDVTFAYSLSAPEQLTPTAAQNVLSWAEGTPLAKNAQNQYKFQVNATNKGATTIFTITPTASTDRTWVHLKTSGSGLPTTKILLRSTTTTDYIADSQLSACASDDALLLGNADGTTFHRQTSAMADGTAYANNSTLVSYKRRVVSAITADDGALKIDGTAVDGQGSGWSSTTTMSGDRSTPYQIGTIKNSGWVAYETGAIAHDGNDFYRTDKYTLELGSGKPPSANFSGSTIEILDFDGVSTLAGSGTGVDHVYVSYKPTIALSTNFDSSSTQRQYTNGQDLDLFLNDDKVLLGPLTSTSDDTLYSANDSAAAGFRLLVSIPNKTTQDGSAIAFGTGFENMSLARSSDILLSQLTIDGDTMGDVSFANNSVTLTASARYALADDQVTAAKTATVTPINGKLSTSSVDQNALGFNPQFLSLVGQQQSSYAAAVADSATDELKSVGDHSIVALQHIRGGTVFIGSADTEEGYSARPHYQADGAAKTNDANDNPVTAANVGSVDYNLIKISNMGTTLSIEGVTQASVASMPIITIKNGQSIVSGSSGKKILVLESGSENGLSKNVSGIYEWVTTGWQRVDYSSSIVPQLQHPVKALAAEANETMNVHIFDVQVDGNNHITGISGATGVYGSGTIESTAGNSTLNLMKATMISGIDIGTSAFELASGPVYYALCAYALDGFVSLIKIANHGTGAEESFLNPDHIYHPERETSLVQDLSFEGRRNRDFSSDAAGAHIEEFRPVLHDDITCTFGTKDMNVVFCSTNNIGDCLVVPSSLRNTLTSSNTF